ncbi:MAG TPA: hypothetical protein VEA59_06450 [Patescibacteria group bacterium]|nr:hypothetical protein [Patescibacteria group bacterium]
MIPKFAKEAFIGSIANNAGLGVIVVYAFTIILWITWTIGALVGNDTNPIRWAATRLTFLCVVILVVGYLFNRPDIDEIARRKAHGRESDNVQISKRAASSN